jgi:hypothetical protein
MSKIPRRDQRFLQEADYKINTYLQSHTGPGVNKMSEITQHIYLSSMEAGLDMTTLKAENIKAILHIGDDSKSKKTLEIYKRKKMTYQFFEIKDNVDANIIPLFEPTYNFIHAYIKQERKVLVHCTAGVSRSAAILAYYLLKRYYYINFKPTSKKIKELISTENYFLYGIVTFLKELRPCIRPNPGFIRQLLLTEYQLKKHFEGIIRKEYGEGHRKRVNRKLNELTEEENSESSNDDSASDEEADDIPDVYGGKKKQKDIRTIIDESMPKKKKSILLKKRDEDENIGKYDVLDDLKNITPIRKK